MCADPRDAAARRRRGVLARAAYAMRKERCAGSPRLPLARAGSIGKVRTPSPALSDASQGASAGCTDSEPKRKRRRPRRRARPALSARCALPPRGVLDAAELGAALDFYDEFTDGGIISARLAVLRRRWSDSRREQQAYSAARCRALPRVDAERESRDGTRCLAGMGGDRQQPRHCVVRGHLARFRSGEPLRYAYGCGPVPRSSPARVPGLATARAPRGPCVRGAALECASNSRS